jgi:hypothetical protein
MDEDESLKGSSFELLVLSAVKELDVEPGTVSIESLKHFISLFLKLRN